ncbi:MAG: hypothetical protein GF421_10805 [Candidatus Aminicenantes bacterium]|nr:hypothetical protein [Candidatus Aminicenantes bacterium]
MQGKLNIHLKDPLLEKFHFNLHGTFQINKLKINGLTAEYIHKKNNPQSVYPCTKQTTVRLPEKSKAKPVRMEIEYHGKLENIPEFGSYKDQKWALDDQINSRMIELANYSCWYPLFTFGNRFDINLELSLPISWKCVCSGEKTKRWKEGQRVFSCWSSVKDTDIVIVASPQLKLESYRVDDVNIHVYHTQLPESFIAKDIKQIQQTANLFTSLLGKTVLPGGTVKHVFSPKQKGQGGAGIARPGMIVTSEGLTLKSLKKDPDYSLFHGIAHEIAHFWWSFGAGQGDWINETFAEYFSSVAEQRIISEEIFQNNLNKYRSLTNSLPENAPPLSIVPFEGGRVNYIVRYYKGSLMLDCFRQQIGDSAFFKICRDFYQTFHEDLIGTPEFRAFWEMKLGKKKVILNKWLDSDGGVPITIGNRLMLL